MPAARPSRTNPRSVILLGAGTTCSGTTNTVDVQGGAMMRVFGDAFINTANGASCKAMNLGNGGAFQAGNTNILQGGSCGGNGCPATTAYSGRGHGPVREPRRAVDQWAPEPHRMRGARPLCERHVVHERNLHAHDGDLRRAERFQREQRRVGRDRRGRGAHLPHEWAVQHRQRVVGHADRDDHGRVQRGRALAGRRPTRNRSLSATARRPSCSTARSTRRRRSSIINGGVPPEHDRARGADGYRLERHHRHDRHAVVGPARDHRSGVAAHDVDGEPSVPVVDADREWR